MVDRRAGLVGFDLGDPDDVRASVTVTPLPTMLALLADIAGERRRGLPPGRQDGISAAVRPRVRHALSVLTVPGYASIPDCLVPTELGTQDGIEPELQRLHELTDDDLVRGLEACYGPGRIPAHWSRVLRQRRRWLGDYADAMAAVWKAVEVVWRRGAPLLEREVERLGRAVVTGGLPVVLGSLSPLTRCVGGTLLLPAGGSGGPGLAGRRLVFAPMLSAPRSLVFNLGHPELPWLGYPIPGVARLWAGTDDARGPGRANALELVCGDVRAAILRALDRRTTMGRLADVVGTSRNALSYHARCLEDAGLVLRRREGREVGIERTERGDRLLDLLTR
ncbi:winged helix-turn-helix domain-containing protein [Saccharothrix variisporea]|uniref:Helix-turn-helix protein n=1 Tax=Saccharothrix variisporea TaxID=543527 RepID=A0A495X5C2_9PSEU|nr:winged helix-turn-helix domain-containing protein [Saccharothrix variisporea]RKT69200.1 helix-turn-helix protein [Saccharothrix variisporea]